MQPLNQVTIRNIGVGLIFEKFIEAFASKAIYSVRDFYFRYNQFQLAEESRNITTMKTPLELVKMYTLQQDAINSVAHIINGINKVLQALIPDKIMSFLDDISIKRSVEEEKK